MVEDRNSSLGFRSVSIVQSVICAAVGVMTMYYTSDDVIHDRFELVTAYAWISGAYFIYDTVLLYKLHCARQGLYNTETNLIGRIVNFISLNTSIFLHHILIVTIAVPVIVVSLAKYFPCPKITAVL